MTSYNKLLLSSLHILKFLEILFMIKLLCIKMPAYISELLKSIKNSFYLIEINCSMSITHSWIQLIVTIYTLMKYLNHCLHRIRVFMCSIPNVETNLYIYKKAYPIIHSDSNVSCSSKRPRVINHLLYQ